MSICALIAEYNPFHNGHKRQIDALRDMGFDCIVCVMSGSFTQRGELAIADKYTRAEAAVCGGADIVLELPFPYSSLSAEGFCRAGVHILASLGCDTLCFGSERADKELLCRAADIVTSPQFITEYSATGKNQGSAKAYFDLLSSKLGISSPLLSNDILGISYVAAIKQGGYNMDIFPIKREGAAYSSDSLGEEYPSATAIRKAVKSSQGGFSSISEAYIPSAALDTLRRAEEGGYAPISTSHIGSDILSFFKLMSPDDISARAIKRSGGGESVACDGCGIVERLCSAARSSSSLEGMLQNAYTSRYTSARINRVLLFSILGVSDIFECSVPQYTTLLAASANGRKYLSETRKRIEFPIVTKPADSPEGSETDILRLSDSLYSSAMPKGVNFDFFIKKHPFMG